MRLGHSWTLSQPLWKQHHPLNSKQLLATYVIHQSTNFKNELLAIVKSCYFFNINGKTYNNQPLIEFVTNMILRVLKWTSCFLFCFFVVPVMFKLCWQHHITYNSVSRSMSRERETEKKDMDTPPGRSKEKKEEKDRKERKRVSTRRTLAPPTAAFC